MRKFLGAAIFLCVLVTAITAKTDQPLTPDQKKAVETLIRDYLLENPEIIGEAIEALQAKQRATEQEAERVALNTHRAELLHDRSSPVSGNTRGDVTVVEFFDYRCEPRRVWRRPFCLSHAAMSDCSSMA